MEFEQIKKKLISFLIENKNVPSTAIKDDLIFTIQTDNGIPFYPAHLVVFDNQLNKPLCLFIIDDGKIRVLKRFIETHLNNINRFINEPIIIYLVSYQNESLCFSEVLDDSSLTPIKKEDFPDFEIMKNDFIILQGMKLEQIEEENQKSMQAQKQAIKSETRFSRFIFLVISVISIISLILYLFSTYKTNSISQNHSTNMIEDFNDLTKCIDSLWQDMRNQHFREKKDSISVDTTLAYDRLNDRITIIEKGISDNPQKTLSNISLEHKINLLQSQLNDLKELNNVRNNALDDKISLISNLIISLYAGVVISFIGWFLNQSKRNKD